MYDRPMLTNIRRKNVRWTNICRTNVRSNYVDENARSDEQHRSLIFYPDSISGFVIF